MRTSARIFLRTITLAGFAAALASSAGAEIIVNHGENPCPGYNARNTSWSDHHGCVCDAGWTGSGCNSRAGTMGGGAGASPSGTGLLDRPGGLTGGAPRNPGNPWAQGGQYEANKERGRLILSTKCRSNGGNPVYFTTSEVHDGQHVKTPTVFCGFRNRRAQTCSHIGNRLWHCGNASPSDIRQANSILANRAGRPRMAGATGTTRAPRPRR